MGMERELAVLREQYGLLYGMAERMAGELERIGKLMRELGARVAADKEDPEPSALDQAFLYPEELRELYGKGGGDGA